MINEWLHDSYIRSIVFFVLTIIGFLVLHILLKKALDFFEDQVLSWKGSKISNIKFQRLTILSAEQIIEILGMVLFIGGWILHICLFVAFIMISLSLFPDTEMLAAQILHAIVNPIKEVLWHVVEYIPKLVLIIVVIFVSRVILRGLRYFFREVERGNVKLRQFHTDWAMPTYQIIRAFILVFALVIIFPNLPGSGSDSFKGISIFVGLLVSFGSSSAVGNIVAGIVLTYMRPFKLNDFVSIDNVTGVVIEKSLLMTRILTQKNEEITIPNSKILSHPMTNYSSPAHHEGVIFHVNVSMPYSVPWKKVTEILKQAATKVKGVERAPKPFVLHNSMHESYMVYELNVYTKHPIDMLQIYSDLREQILADFEAEDISMVSPIYYSLNQPNTQTNK